MLQLLKRLSVKSAITLHKEICSTFQRNLTVSNLLLKSTKSNNVYLIDESSDELPENSVNNYTKRTHTCGELRSDNVGETVKLYGWLHYQRMNKFIVLRDGHGETQLLISDNDVDAQKQLENTSLESVIQIEGTVVSRPKDMINSKQTTGEIEVLINKFQVVNPANHVPFNIREYSKAKESLRMQYRYMDLRFPQMQRNLRVRSKFLMKMREFLINNHFVDVETPTLFKATPGGAQEFIVPTRFPGQFYSLVQSPQQFKQTLMAGAIDKYFQIARCYRDEGSRPDRQPEFTQLDIEMSFTDSENVIKLIEDLLGFCWPSFLNPLPPKFPRLTFNDAMELYGCDKPDTRFDFKLKNCTELLKTNEKLSKVDDFGGYCLIFPKEYATLTKSLKQEINEKAVGFKSVKLVQSKVPTVKEWANKVGKLISTQIANELAGEFKLSDGSVVFLAYGDKKETLKLLGQIRLLYVDNLENLGVSVRRKGMHFLWVYDFPLFEIKDGELQSAHHPFTTPHPEDANLLESDPSRVRALAYDLVLNGNEVGGGSIRIHNAKLQETVLNMLRIDSKSMQHLLDMLKSGCPPHGGIALGLDRLLSIILNTTSIRDVIAFPKTFEGRDPFSGAPSEISEKEEKIYHIQSIKEQK